MLWIILARLFCGEYNYVISTTQTNASVLTSTAELDIPPAVQVLLSSRSRRIGLHTGLVMTEFRVPQTCLQIPNRGKTIWMLLSHIKK